MVLFISDISLWLVTLTPAYISFCLNASFFSTNDEVTREQRQQLTQAEKCEILLWDTSQFIQISRTTNLLEHVSTKLIMDNVMINHLTGFLNKCMLAFKRDNHLETLSSVKQKTPRPLADVFSVSRMTSFLMIIPYIAVGITDNKTCNNALFQTKLAWPRCINVKIPMVYLNLLYVSLLMRKQHFF